MIALVAESAFVFGAKYIAPQSKLFGIIEANALVDETNQNRVANDLPDLQVSPLLQAAAQEKANDMATKGYFAHTSPQGLTPWYWFEQVGYNFDYAGENLAVNFSDSQDVTNAWMNSPEHRANILSANFTQIGIATAQGIYNGEPATYVVEEFGTPAPAVAPVAFVNTANAATASGAERRTTRHAGDGRTKPKTHRTGKKPAPASPSPNRDNRAGGRRDAKFVRRRAHSRRSLRCKDASNADHSGGSPTAVRWTHCRDRSASQRRVISSSCFSPIQKRSPNDFYFLLMVLFLTRARFEYLHQYPRAISATHRERLARHRGGGALHHAQSEHRIPSYSDL